MKRLSSQTDNKISDGSRISRTGKVCLFICDHKLHENEKKIPKRRDGASPPISIDENIVSSTCTLLTFACITPNAMIGM